MRIGIVSTMNSAPWGGSEELWAAMANRALQAGFRVSVCVLRPHPRHEKWEALKGAGADVFCQASERWHSRGRTLVRGAQMLNYRLGKYLYGKMSPLRSLFSTRPDVLLVNDGASLPPSDIIDAVQRHHSSKPYLILSQANLGNIPEENYRKRAAAFYRGARSALFVSDNNLRATEQQLLEKLRNARVIRNPVNLDRIESVDWPEEDTISLASIGRLEVAAKGQEILLEALSDAQWRHRNWRLSIFGTGRDRAYLEGLSAYFSLADRVSFLGQTDDIRGVWQAHQALVLPSRVEGTPIVMVEAMLCGRPVIGTTVAGIPEWVRDGRNGFLADAPTVNCLKATLETAWHQRAKWQTMGNTARRDALFLYDPAPGDTLLSIVTEARHAHQGICNRPLGGATELVDRGSV
jgi:glycosyltransferase involved in cell wall biosynthesis